MAKSRSGRVTTPTVLQMEATECGAAALAIVLAYYGRYVPLEELRVECRVSRDGSNALYVKKTAEKYGLTGRGYQFTIDELRDLEPPFVVFWELNHFLVVECFARGRVYLSDPASGRRSIDEAAFRASYTGIVFKFEPGPGFRKGGVKPNTWKAVLRRIRGARRAAAYVVLAGLAVAACELAAATYNLVFVDQLLIEQRRHWVRPLILVMGLTAVLRLAAGLIQQAALRRLKLGLAMVHSAKFLWHVLRLPVSFYQQRYAGDVSGRVDGNSLAAELISGQLATTAVGLIMVVFHAALVFAFDPTLAVVGAVFGGLNLAAISAASRLLSDENLKIKQVRGRLQGSMMRAVQIIETIKAGSLEPETLVRLSGYQARITNSFQVVGAAGAALVALPPLLLTATTAAVLWIGGGRVIEGALSVGALVALQTLMIQFHRPFGDLVRLGTSVQALQAELARLDDVRQFPLDPVFTADRTASERPAANEAGGPAPRRLTGHLELRDVTFGYSRTIDEPLISHFSLEIRPGSRVAIVGGSGSGKSTIGRLVSGLLRPWSGQILYDGRPIDAIPRDVFTNQVALVDDQTFLFSGTVRENLTLWDESVPGRDVIRAAIDAGIHRDLIHRRGGYQAHVAEGARNLSGGQRQRLEIGRALIQNPALLVLDEATSALDPVTEALVDDNLRRRGCTCLIIAHRLSTIRDCDEIVVLHQGRVVQRGTHEELLADERGYYRELHDVQDAPEAPPRGERSSPRDRPAVSLAPEDAEPDVDADVFTSNGHHALLPAAAPDAVAASALPSIERSRAIVTELERYGETVETAGNNPLPLDDAGAVWRVTAGQVDVFYVDPPEPGQERGRRRHLCRVEEQGSIFAIDGDRSRDRGGLLAVGVGAARLLKFPKADLLRLSLEPDWRRGVAEMIDDWVDRISRATGPGEPPPTDVWLEPGDPSVLTPGACASTRSRVLWVRQTGCGLRFFGTVAVPECPYDSRFPLSSHAWLTFDRGEGVRPWDTETYMENGDPWAGLERFHRAILDAIAESGGREAALRGLRLDRAARLDRARVAASLAGLATVAGRARDEVGAIEASAEADADGRREEALLEACRAVAAAVGVEVKSPRLDAADDPLRLIARASGFRTRRVRLDEGWWARDGGPLLGYTAEGARPVALLPCGERGYSLFEPGRRVRSAVTAEVAQGLSPTAVTFTKVLGGLRPGAFDLVRFGLPYVRREIRTVLRLGVVSGLLGLVVPVVTAVVIDDAIPRAGRWQLGLLCGFLVAVGLAVAGFQTLQGLALARMKGRLESTLLPAVWDRLLGLPTAFFGLHESGDLALRALGLARVIEALASTSVATLLVGIFSLANLIVLFALDWRLALIALGLLGVWPVVMVLSLPSLWGLQRSIAGDQGRISGFLLVLLGGIARLRVAGAERRAFARWAEMYRGQLERMIRFQTLSDRVILFGDVWPLFVAMAVFAAVIGLGPDTLTAGGFLAFNLALGQGTGAVIGLGRGVLPLLNGLEQYERARPLLKADPEDVEADVEAVTLGGAIRLTNVSFRYDADGPLILDAVSLHVRPGEFVAVVGPSGSGKSTLLRLLLGFETPGDGVIAYDGRELATLDVREVRRQIGVVLQDAQLVPGDVYSNIVGFSSQLTLADAQRAADLSGLADDVAAMPMGIHTVIGEGGGGLSSGQRQRLIIARALARKPRVLFFDEATSALDNKAQAFVSESLRAKLGGTSRLAIAHRLSTVVEADRIYVLSEGRIVQSGRYSQLISEPGPFQDLARRQTLT